MVQWITTGSRSAAVDEPSPFAPVLPEGPPLSQVQVDAVPPLTCELTLIGHVRQRHVVELRQRSAAGGAGRLGDDRLGLLERPDVVVPAGKRLGDRVGPDEAGEHEVAHARLSKRVRDDLDAAERQAAALDGEVNASLRMIAGPVGRVLTQLQDVDGAPLSSIVERAGRRSRRRPRRSPRSATRRCTSRRRGSSLRNRLGDVVVARDAAGEDPVVGPLDGAAGTGAGRRQVERIRVEGGRRVAERPLAVVSDLLDDEVAPLACVVERASDRLVDAQGDR